MASTLGAFFHRYRRAFEKYDLDALVSLIELPCLMAGGERIGATTTEADLRERLARQFERHREAEVADAQFELLASRRLTARFVQAEVDWRLLRADGSMIQRFGVSYMLTSPEDGWRILSVFPYDVFPPKH